MKHILVADDELPIREWLKASILSLFPEYTVHTAANGKEALDNFRAERPEIVFTDIRMPLMDGLTLIEEIQKIAPETHVFILTSYDDFDYVRSALKSHVREYILKTEISPDLLRRIIDGCESLPTQKSGPLHISDAPEIFSAIDESVLKSNAAVDISGKTYSLPVGSYVCLAVKNESFKRPGSPHLSEILWLEFEGGIHLSCCEISVPSTLDQHDLSKGAVRDIVRANPGAVVSYSEIQSAVSQLAASLEDVFRSLALAFYSDADIIHAKRDTEDMYLSLNYLYLQLINSIQKQEYPLIPDKLHSLFGYIKEQMPVDVEFIRNLCKKICESAYLQGYSADPAIYAEKYQETEIFIDAVARFSDLAEYVERQCTDTLSGLSQLSSYTAPVANALKYIKNNYGTIQGLSEVAGSVYLNPEYFSRLFKEETGQNFSNYLNDYRLDQSLDLLLHSSKKVYQIAEEVGFSSLSYYSKNFKKRYGINPFSYRNAPGTRPDQNKL
ncbi:MAG: response regulator transcription factor [Christensenellaceae bacterium]|jgi:two-component system response regulator YesN